MSRIPLSEEVIDGEDTTEMEYTQVTAENPQDDYEPLDFDVVERYLEPPPETEWSSDPDTRKFE